MKNTIISITLLLLSVTTLHSCRTEDMDQNIKDQHLTVEIHKQNTSLKSGKDSVRVTESSHYDENGNLVSDPPPKDRDHW